MKTQKMLTSSGYSIPMNKRTFFCRRCEKIKKGYGRYIKVCEDCKK